VLIDVMSGKVIHTIPYRPQFDALRARLSEDEFESMVARIDELIDEGGAEIATAGSGGRHRRWAEGGARHHRSPRTMSSRMKSPVMIEPR